MSTEASSSASGEQLTKKRSLSVGEDENKPPKCVKFEELDDIFSHYTGLSEFCVEGTVELNENTSQLFYKSSNAAMQCIDVLNISKKEIDTLVNSCSPSPFGMGSKSLVDLSVRQAKELRAADFSFQFNPLMKSIISSQIKKLLGGREFLVEPYKLNIYSEVGHFKRHKNTLKNEKMIASLIVCLPIPFEGGILTVENVKRTRMNLDWGREITTSTVEIGKIYWACFFCSCDHIISKVTKGNRITIAYDIFRDDSKPSDDDDDDAEKMIPERYLKECSENLQTFVKNIDVKEIYGYFPNHVYSFRDTENYDEINDIPLEEQKDLRDKLKGNDLLLYDTLKQQGWKVTLEVYYPDIESFGPYIEFETRPREKDIYMEDAIREDDKETLNKLSTLKLLNNLYKCNSEEIHDYKIVYGYTGNSPIREGKSFYAGTIMILRHQTRSEAKEENVEKNESF